MLNEMDKRMAKTIPVEALPAIHHMIGNKLQPIQTRIDILRADLEFAEAKEGGWRESYYIVKDIRNVVETFKICLVVIDAFLDEVENREEKAQ